MVLKNAPAALPEVADLIESEDSSESERPERALEGIDAVRFESLNKRRVSSFSAACNNLSECGRARHYSRLPSWVVMTYLDGVPAISSTCIWSWR